jgi:uncharacterized membrane protein YheB (UPF0754 family)
MTPVYLSMPFIGALIGALVLYFGSQLLFFPRRPIKIGPWILLGWLRKQWPKISAEISEKVEQELLSQHHLEQIADQMDLERELSPLIDQRLNNMVNEVKAKNPMIAMFVSDSLVDEFKGKAKDELLQMVPELKEMAISKLFGSPALVRKIENKILRYDLDAVEGTVLQKLRSPLLAVGACIGFLLGLVQVLLMWLIR